LSLNLVGGGLKSLLKNLDVLAIDELFHGDASQDINTSLRTKVDEARCSPEDFLAAGMQEEIFGPILPVLSFKTLEDVPARIRALGQPLALYVFSHSQANVDFLLGQTSSGAVGINEVVPHNANPYLPFGRIGRLREEDGAHPGPDG
jgi:Aldehyde dehydrogenase family